MHSVLALLRATWLTATSYRVATVMSIASLLASVVPVYFIATAVEPIARDSIRLEGTSYFGFVVLGLAASYVLMAATGAIPSAIAGNIGSGIFESLLATRAPLPVLLAGLSAYPLAQAFMNATVVVLGAVALGVRLEPVMLPAVLVLLLLLVLAQAGIGMVAAALVLVFRTSGPLVTAVVGGSNLLGGVFYSTTAIPGWLQSLSGLFPLTYALRATRRLLLADASLLDVSTDAGILALLAVLCVGIGSVSLRVGMRHARRAGTLTHY
jgi:ABC-2 type transport system permease protein